MCVNCGASSIPRKLRSLQSCFRLHEKEEVSATIWKRFFIEETWKTFFLPSILVGVDFSDLWFFRKETASNFPWRKALVRCLILLPWKIFDALFTLGATWKSHFCMNIKYAKRSQFEGTENFVLNNVRFGVLAYFLAEKYVVYFLKFYLQIFKCKICLDVSLQTIMR